MNDEAKKKAHAALPLTTENNKKPSDGRHFIHYIAKIPGISKTTFIGVWIGQRSKEMKLLTKKYDNNYNNEITPLVLYNCYAKSLALRCFKSLFIESLYLTKFHEFLIEQ